MNSGLTKQAALALFKSYNSEPFHLLYALTVEGIMRWYAKELGYADDIDFWGIAGPLHDIDYKKYPDEHCCKIICFNSSGTSPTSSRNSIIKFAFPSSMPFCIPSP